MKNIIIFLALCLTPSLFAEYIVYSKDRTEVKHLTTNDDKKAHEMAESIYGKSNYHLSWFRLGTVICKNEKGKLWAISGASDKKTLMGYIKSAKDKGDYYTHFFAHVVKK